MARVRSNLVTGLSSAMGSDEFVIVELTKDGAKPVYDHRGELMTFTCGEDASREARAMTATGRKFQPRRVKDDTWREREQSRFGTKEYKTLPWAEAVWWKNHRHIWGDHYPHVSQKNSVGLMAYTETDGKGSADVQTPIKPGKYLERYFNNVLDSYIIRDLCTIFSNVFEDNCLLLTDSEDEFESFYTSGPSSCMSHPKDKYTSHIHPVRVYAGGDLALVYMKRDGRIVARALCWPEKKTYSRIYGDVGRIEPLLNKDGWKKGTPFGAKMQRVMTWENKRDKSGKRALVIPHIDDANHVFDMGDHLIIGGGSVKPGGTLVKCVGASGVSEWLSIACKCGKEGPLSSMSQVFVDDGGKQVSYCADCVKSNTFKCMSSSSYIVDNKLAVEMFDGKKMWRRRFAEGHGFACAVNGKNYPIAYAVMVKDRLGRDVRISKEAFKEGKYAPCATCGNHTPGGECQSACKTAYDKMVKRAGLAPTGVTFTSGYSSSTAVWQEEMPRRR